MNRRAAALILGLGAALAPGVPPARAEGPVPELPALPQPVCSFDVEVGLDPATHRLKAKGRMRWRNAGPGPVSSLWMHLYLNAFKNDLSTFLRESRGKHRGHEIERDGGWGWIDLTEARLADGRDLLAGKTFEAPDDGNFDDRTVLRLPLPAPVEEGRLVELDLAWEAQLPRVFARTGWHGDFHMVGQWFPKPGVRRPRDPDPAGDRAAREGWSCRQFHANSEFFSDFGDYRVRITVPPEFVVAATGRETGVADGPDGTKVHTFEQRGVIDFAWAASPRFRLVRRAWRYEDDPDPAEEKRLAAAFGIPPDRVRPAGSVDCLLYLQPEHEDQAERHFRALAHSLRYFGLRYGAYPYATISLVDPAYGAGGAGGMEYPTLITTGTRLFPHPGAWSPEVVTVHEFGHQYFALGIASNEAEEAWLDEGLTTYATARVLETAYPGGALQVSDVAGVPADGVPPGSFPGVMSALAQVAGLDEKWRVPANPLLDALRDAPPMTWIRGVRRDPFLGERARWLPVAPSDPLSAWSWKFFDRQSYGSHTYARTCLTLRTLENLLGRETMDRALRIYAARGRFRHPTGEDFFRTVVETSGRPEMPALLDRLFRRPVDYDYSVAEVVSTRITRGSGVFDAPGGGKRLRGVDGAEDGKEEPGEERRFQIEVALRRRGDPPFPAEGRMRLADGKEVKVGPWDGKTPWTRLRFVAGSEPVELLLDPDRKVLLEGERGNDAWRKVRDDRAAWRWGASVLRWVQGVLFSGGTMP